MTPRARPGEDAAVLARLRDGRRVVVRKVLASDEHAIGEFIAGLGLEARRLRFFSGGVDVARMTHTISASGPDRLGLVALDRTGAVVGHALCIELGDGHAEVAVEVADQLHGQGLGTVLIERLSELAEQRGITTFDAQVLPENRAMLDVFKDGFDAHLKWAEGVDRVEFPTSAWRLARERYSAMFERGASATR